MKPTLLLVTIASALLIILSSCGTSGTLTLDEVVRTPDERFIDIDGYRINYRDSGSPSGIADYPVILLYHGFGGNLANFDQVYPTLAREFRVIAFDRPPFGYSEKALKRDFADYDPYRPEAPGGFGHTAAGRTGDSVGFARGTLRRGAGGDACRRRFS
jgi:hypothetical protein